MVLSRRPGSILLVIVGVALAVSPAVAEDISCSTTASLGPAAPFILPPPYDALPKPPEGQFVYGTQALWTHLTSDGRWHGLYREDLHAYRNKLTVWRPGIDWRTGNQPLTVTVRRLDGDAPAVQIPEASGVFAEGMGSAMMTAVNLPTTGCWEFTA